MIDIKDIHIGKAIKQRFDELGLTKTEFGNRIGVPQQHINRIFEKDSIDTKRLARICRALDYDFFGLYSAHPTSVTAQLSAVSLAGDALNNIGDGALAAFIEAQKQKIADMEESKVGLRSQIQLLKDSIEQLKSQLRDKDELISVYKNK